MSPKSTSFVRTETRLESSEKGCGAALLNIDDCPHFVSSLAVVKCASLPRVRKPCLLPRLNLLGNESRVARSKSHWPANLIKSTAGVEQVCHDGRRDIRVYDSSPQGSN